MVRELLLLALGVKLWQMSVSCGQGTAFTGIGSKALANVSQLWLGNCFYWHWEKSIGKCQSAVVRELLLLAFGVKLWQMSVSCG